MWLFLLIVGLLHQNHAAPRPGEPDVDVQMFLQEQMEAVTPSDSSSSSSSSSSSTTSESSESSQSSEGTQQIRERLNQENMAMELMDSSQESPNDNSTGQWVNELTLLMEDTHHGQSDGEENSKEVEHQALLLKLHHLLGDQQTKAVETTMNEVGGDTTNVNQDVLTEEGGANTGTGVLYALHESTEQENELTFDVPELDHHHGHHGDEADLELSL